MKLCENCEQPTKNLPILDRYSEEEAFSIVSEFLNNPENYDYNHRKRILRVAKAFGIDIPSDKLKKRRQTKYTKEQLSLVVGTSKSYAECLKKLGIKPIGGNYRSLQKNIDRFNLDTSHMLHQAANQGVEFKTFDSLTTNDSIKKRLVIERGHKCESCLNTHWLSDLIMLELEHIDGNNRNNDRSNLKLLCPNCHSQTPTWRNRKRK